MHIFKDTHFDFLRWRVHAIVLSWVVIIAGAIVFMTKGIPLGIEFAGGTAVIVKFEQPTSVQQVRGALDRSFPGGGQNVMSILGSPAALPRTLVIHHRQDSCRATLPAGVDPFIKWSAGRARVSWLTGGMEEGDPCQARGHHGFNGLDSQVVALAAGFR